MVKNYLIDIEMMVIRGQESAIKCFGIICAKAEANSTKLLYWHF